MTAAEIRQSLDEHDASDGACPLPLWTHALTDAARAYVDLLDSDALIIRRDENGEWPDAVLDWVETYLGQYDWQTALRAFDALASSQGVDP